MEVCQYLDRLHDELYAAGYSKQTINTYVAGMKSFSTFFTREFRYARNDDFQKFKIFLRNKNLEPKTINTYLASVRYFYRYIMHRKMDSLKCVRQKKKLPVIQDRRTILSMLNNTKNPKHRLLINLIYSSGLRVSEAVRLKKSDLDIHNKLCKIRQGKGKKDRFTILSDCFIAEYKAYIDEANPVDFIFHGRNGHLCTRSAQEIIKKSAKEHVFPHSLRSSFATHLIENDVPIHKVQKLLGHSQIETTLGYIRSVTIDIKGIKSPLDI